MDIYIKFNSVNFIFQEELLDLESMKSKKSPDQAQKPDKPREPNKPHAVINCVYFTCPF